MVAKGPDTLEILNEDEKLTFTMHEDKLRLKVNYKNYIAISNYFLRFFFVFFYYFFLLSLPIIP